VIVTGSATAFCAGADLQDLLNASEGNKAGVKRVYDGFLSVANCKLPTIAAVNGPAVGAGMNLAIACDLRIVSRSALFDTRFLQLGLHQGGGHAWMLLRTLSAQVAAGLLLFGEKVDGEEAARIGLAKFCTEDDALMDEAVRYARRAARAPRELLIRMKETLLRSAQIKDHQQAVDMETLEQMWSLQQPAFQKLTESMKSKVTSDR
jgi:enoyl-CoA hydratase